MEYTTLNNGVRMPMLGYGVFQIPAKDTARCVRDALDAGYRLVDTAQAYFNEEAVGQAVKESGLKRDDVFITDKVWVSNANHDRAAASIDESLRKLGTDHIDLMLLHQAYGDYHGAWRAMEEALDAGKLRAIGVSNFDPVRLMDLAEFARVAPAVNQVETHPFWQQRPAHKVMDELGVVHEAWSPFAEGHNGLFHDPVLSKIAQAHGKTVAQVVLRALVQEGVVVIPKSTHAKRMRENFDVFDFSLTDDEMDEFRGLDGGKALILDHTDPAAVKGVLDYAKGQTDGPLY